MGSVPTVRTFQASETETAAYLNSVGAAISFLLNPPHCKVYQSGGGVSQATGVWLLVAFDLESFDTDGMHDTTTNNSRLTFNTAGQYRILGSVAISTNASGGRALHLRKNAGGNVSNGTSLAYRELGPPSSLSTIFDIDYEDYFAAGDYVELFAYQSSGSSLTIGGTSTFFQARWVATS